MLNIYFWAAAILFYIVKNYLYKNYISLTCFTKKNCEFYRKWRHNPSYLRISHGYRVDITDGREFIET
jgi:hypothetical protein